MRALAIAALFAAGCYDVGGLSRSFTAGDGGVSDAAPIGAGQWREVASASTAPLRGVFGSDGGDVFAVGATSTIIRLGASGAATVESAPPGVNLRAVWAGGSGSLAAGDNQTVLMRGAAAWDGPSLGDATLYAVTGLPGGEAISVGSGGTVTHLWATGWTVEDAQVTVHLRGAFGRAAGDILVVGDGGTIVHAAGAAPLAWATEPSGVTTDLFAVWARAGDAWAVGAGGVVLHAGADGAWAPEASGVTVDLFGVFGAGDRVWAVGGGGTILLRSGGAWSVEHSGGGDLRAVWAGANGAWAAGDGGAILQRP
ncbi:MAG: Type fimbrial biosis protein PilY1 [bacterium]|nr:Type fimbrial biosis protein PilY1 [bacterium]